MDVMNMWIWPAAGQGCKVDVRDKNTCKVLTILIRQMAAIADGLAPWHDSTGKQLKLGLEQRHVDAGFHELRCGARQMVLIVA
jgi:hypothetical protein